MSDFTELPVANGVEQYHINRFRICFPAPAGKSPNALGRELVAGFPNFFNPNLAIASFGPSSHGGDATIDFEFKAPGPNFHHDWVYICGRRDDADCAGFAAQTLKRNFEDGGDGLLRAAVVASVGAAIFAFPLLLPISGPLGVVMARKLGNHLVWVNQHHFLAGRRSWMLVDPLKLPGARGGAREKAQSATTQRTNRYVYNPIYYLETAAIERSSLTIYMVLEKVPQIVDEVISDLGALGAAMSLLLAAIPGLRRVLVKLAQGVAREILQKMGLDLRKSIVDIWCTLLTNYVKAKGFDAVATPPALALPSERGRVTYQELFAGAPTGQVVSEIRAVHPAL